MAKDVNELTLILAKNLYLFNFKTGKMIAQLNLPY